MKKSAGIALVTVLLIVATASIAAVSISSRLQVDIRRTENLLRADQAWQHMLGAESWAKGMLAEDIKDNPEFDHEGESWAAPMKDDVEGGEIEGKIIDQQGLFNINNLLTKESNTQQEGDNQAQSLVPSVLDIERFKRLLVNLDLDVLLVDELTMALLDWLDDDPLPNTYGAEDDFYQSLEPAYSTANRLMAHRSELLLVKGFTSEIYEKLAPFVTALPEYAFLNVNTAKPEVLQCLYKGLTKRNVDDLVDTREGSPFENISDFKSHQAVSGLNVAKNSFGIDVKSSYFRLHSRANVGQARIAVTSLLHRLPAGDVNVVQRMREDIF